MESVLNKIFKDNPHILEYKEVKEVLEYCESVMRKNVMICERNKNQNDKVREILVYSNRFIIGGNSDQYTIDLLMEEINNNNL